MKVTNLDWKILKFSDAIPQVIDFRGKTPAKLGMKWGGGTIPALSANNVKKGYIDLNAESHMASEALYAKWMKKGDLKKGDIIFTMEAPLGNVAMIPDNSKYILSQRVVAFRPAQEVSNKYLFQYLLSDVFQNRLGLLATGSTAKGVNQKALGKITFKTPSQAEQNRIVAVLETWDKAIEKIKNKIKIKSQIKKDLMSKVLTGKIKLKSFTESWKKVKLDDISINLDNKRVPINSGDRAKKRGVIPYCGANGIVDYIDEYIFDEDLILIAEDGGQFDEYATRPIAYRMSGKFWVNNHAHVIKAKKGFSQDLLFYLTVNKNILKYLNGGTRAKLNKSELSKIEYLVPSSETEQTAIAELLNHSSSELDLLQKRLKLLIDQKKYLLNNLITGNIRIPETLAWHSIKCILTKPSRASSQRSSSWSTWAMSTYQPKRCWGNVVMTQATFSS